jgi:hypothetical protein
MLPTPGSRRLASRRMKSVSVRQGRTPILDNLATTPANEPPYMPPGEGRATEGRIALRVCTALCALALDLHPALKAGAGMMLVVHASPPLPPIRRCELS